MHQAGARNVAAVQSSGQANNEPSLRHMLALWVPLAASIVMMVLEPSIINIGLGRTADPELALAAYGVAYGLALVVEAPILMLLDASVARSSGPSAFALIRRFTLVSSLVVTAIGLIFSLTPLFDWVLLDVMGIPLDVAAWARPTLQILSFWPLPIAWRRTHQGVLIRDGRTNIITVATGVRLVVLAVCLFGGLWFLPDQGAVVAGIAMDISVIVEAGLITAATRPVLVSARFQSAEKSDGYQRLTPRDLWRFYQPLAVTTLLRQLTRPMLNTGIAAALLPLPSLAAWPVTWGLVTLIGGPAWSLQQLTTALAGDLASYRRVRRFSLALSVIFTLLFGLIAFTPLYGLVMGGIYNLSPDLQDLARPATQLMVVYPILMGIQSLLRGVLIREGCTGTVRSAMVLNVAVVAVTLLLGVVLLSTTGVLLAAAAVLAGALAEWAWLGRKFRW